jgi:hypothetical protein
MPESCDRCVTLDRWLRDLKSFIDEEIGKRERGFATSDEDFESQQALTELLSSLTHTQGLFDQHRLRFHRASPKAP